MKTTTWIISLIILTAFVACKYKKPEQPTTTSVPANHYQNFDSINTAYWEYQLYGFSGNGCNMRQENVSINNSILSLTVELNNDTSLPMKYNGGELADKRFYLYGYYSVRMKASICPGTVSAFFLMNQWQPTNWEHKEIDIEFLGKDRYAIQCTNHDFQDSGKTWKSASRTLPLDFDIGDDFHDYGILWTPDSVSWFVDQQLINTEKMYVPQVPLQIRMNYYAGDVNVQGIQQWLGNVDETCLPSKMQYDWISIETLDQYHDRLLNKK